MIKRLVIEKMFGWKNFDIEFKEDLTLLVGLNGSGKTTILNIISSMALGDISFIKKYIFSSVELFYTSNQNEKKLNSIKIIIDDEGNCNLFWGKYCIYLCSFVSDDRTTTKEEFFDGNNKLTAILENIRKELNMFYLPLSRNTQFLEEKYNKWESKHLENKNQYLNNKFLLLDQDKSSINSIDNSLVNINKIVKEYQRKTGIELEELNTEMNREMLQSFFSYEENMFSTSTIENMKKFQEIDIHDLKNAIREMKFFNEVFDDKIDNFVKKINEGYKKYDNWQLNKNNKKNKVILDNYIMDFMGNMPQISKIMKWYEIIQDTNTKKEKLQSNIKKFLEITNTFLKESNKELVLNDKEGTILFIQSNFSSKKEITLDKLSSGEKQIVIFFAYLIFEVNSKNKGIYIIDEPELSLHISWQMNFAKSILEVAPNVQLIFATHSAEIAGHFKRNSVILRG